MELTLQRNASDTGLRAVLTKNGQPVAFASRVLSDAETNFEICSDRKGIIGSRLWSGEVSPVSI